MGRPKESVVSLAWVRCSTLVQKHTNSRGHRGTQPTPKESLSDVHLTVNEFLQPRSHPRSATLGRQPLPRVLPEAPVVADRTHEHRAGVRQGEELGVEAQVDHRGAPSAVTRTGIDENQVITLNLLILNFSIDIKIKNKNCK